jgi:hypothetical protein
MKLISTTSAQAFALGVAIVATLLLATGSPQPETRAARVVIELPPVLITGQSERASSAAQHTARNEPVEARPMQ